MPSDTEIDNQGRRVKKQKTFKERELLKAKQSAERQKMFSHYKEVDIHSIDYDKEYYKCLFNYLKSNIDSIVQSSNYDMNMETIGEVGEYQKRLLQMHTKDDNHARGLMDLEDDQDCQKQILQMTHFLKIYYNKAAASKGSVTLPHYHEMNIFEDLLGKP